MAHGLGVRQVVNMNIANILDPEEFNIPVGGPMPHWRLNPL